MERKNVKTALPKKVADLLAKQSQILEDKKYNPGQVQFFNTQKCRSRLVTFFGDIHTQAFSLKVNKNDKLLGVGCSNGQVKVYDIKQGSLAMMGNTSRQSGFPCTAFKWKPITQQDFLACNCDGTIKWYDSKNDKAYGHSQRQDIAYLCCDYQIKQQWCVLGTDKDTIQIFDNQTMKLTQEYKAGGPNQLNFNHHTNRVFCVKCLPNDPFVFFSGGWDSTVQVWDVRVKEGSVRRICGPSVSSDSLDFKGNVLLSGNYQNNNTVQLYDFSKGTLIQTLDINQPQNSSSYCLTASFAQRSQNNLIAVGLTGSNKVKILLDNKVVSQIQLQAAPLSLDFYRWNNKDFLIVGGIQGTIYCFRIKCLQ